MKDYPGMEEEFSFTIDFEKGKGDPRRIFNAGSLLIDAFESIDDALTPVVDSKIKSSIVLDDVEAGSLKVWLRNTLQRVPDEALKDLEWKKAVGHYLIVAKYKILEFCDDESASAIGSLKKLEGELRQLGKASDIRHLPDYAPIHEGRLLASLDRIQNAKRSLGPNDRLIIGSSARNYEVDLTKTWLPSEIIPTSQTTETFGDGQIILTIRKPDLLGGAMWQFSHGRNSISAPIRDDEWLNQFHNREIALYSGDSLRCDVRFTYVYDQDGVLIEQRTEIIKVLDVINGSDRQFGFDL
ncbi:MAG: hypothetical protein J0G33_03185 [Afipia felis]|nr:hypothetical protein [Afipia felis]